MRKKNNDNLLEKIVKKDYNNELEKVLEKKYFDENVKSILLSILYKIETSYKDYKKVKQNVETKEELIERIIEEIQNNCDEIKLIKPHSEESKMIGNKTFLVEKNNKRIICYHMERKLLYSISKISKNEKIIKDNYFLINETLSNLINVGDNINTVEPLRDFNGYSWTTIPREIESIDHNLIYQNLIILIGNKFLKNWIYNNEFIIDYMELFKNRMEETYGEEIANKLIEVLKVLSILIDMKFNSKKKTELLNEKKKVEEQIQLVQDNEKFIDNMTNQKRKLAEEIRKIDETINNKSILQEEYEKRNDNLPIEEKIFSIRILSKQMIEEREKKIERIEKINELLKPQNFVKYKRKLREKEKYLKLANTKDLVKEIEKYKLEFQKIFLECFKTKVEKAQTKQEILTEIYEFRYYLLLPYNQNKNVNQIEKLEEKIEEIEKKLIQKAQKMKVLQIFSKKEEIDYQLVKNIFETRSINLEEVAIKLTKEKEEFFIHRFDGNSLEEKSELNKSENLKKKDLEIRLNKKVKIFY